MSPNTIRKEPIGLRNIKGIKLLEYGMKITTRSASWSSLMLLITIVWSLPTLTWNSVSSPTNSHPEMHTPPLYEEGYSYTQPPPIYRRGPEYFKYTYIHAHIQYTYDTHTYTHTRTHTIYIHTHIHTHTQIHICIHTYTHTHTYTYTHIHV